MTPRQKLGKARVRTFDYVPYLASYIYQLREQETPGIGTAAVDKAGNMYWDPRFVEACSLDELAYTITHEALHLVFAHAQRAKDILGNAVTEQVRYIWNVAADLVIEQTLACMREHRPAGVVALGVKVPELGNMVLDFPPNQSADVYYRMIHERLREQQQKQPPPPPRPSPDDQGDDDEEEYDDEGTEPGDSDDDDTDADADAPGDNDDADGDEPGDADDEGDEGDDDGDPGDQGGDEDADDDAPGDGDGTADGEPDDAGDNGEPGDGDADGDQPGDEADGPCSPGAGGSAADGFDRPYEVEDDGSWENLTADTAAEATEQAIREYEAAHGVGSVPGTLKQELHGRLHPQPDPFAMLRAAVATSIASPVGGRSTSYRRPSRRQGPSPRDPLLHGWVTVAPNAVVIVDTSGSMGYPEIRERCLTVVSQGLSKLRSVRVVCADTRLQSSAMLTSLSRFQWEGGGGTSMDAVLEEVDAKYQPDAIVLVTDAETAWPAKATRARVVVAAVCRADSHYFKAIPAWCNKVCMVQEGGAK